MTQYPIDGFKNSLWFATAVDEPTTEPLQDDLSTDVLVVGAGITGLNVAIELAQNGVSVVVVDAGVVGGGASGRNGGQVNLGLNLSPDELAAHYGPKAAEPLLQAIFRTPDTVFDRIKRLGINCDAEQNGWIQGAVTEKRFADHRRVAEEFANHGIEMEQLDRAEIARRTGSGRYVGGLFVKQAGCIQPLSYSRELARVAIESGVKIFSHSAVETLKQRAGDAGWDVSTGAGTVSANKVLICTNGYTDKAVSGLAKKLVPVRSVQVATEPLSDELRSKILPNRSTLVDKRRMILYGRYDRDGRLTMGDHGPMRDDFALEDFDNVKARAIDVYPELADVRWDYHWGGRLAITKDSLPFLFEPSEHLMIGMGYNGRGVGMGTMMGLSMASRVLGKNADEAFMPVTVPDEFVFHAFHKIGAEVIIRWELLMDRLEDSRS